MGDLGVAFRSQLCFPICLLAIVGLGRMILEPSLSLHLCVLSPYCLAPGPDVFCQQSLVLGAILIDLGSIMLVYSLVEVQENSGTWGLCAYLAEVRLLTIFSLWPTLSFRLGPAKLESLEY